MRVAKQGLSGELMIHSSQQRAKARQPPLPHAAPGNVQSSQMCYSEADLQVEIETELDNRHVVFNSGVCKSYSGASSFFHRVPSLSSFKTPVPLAHQINEL